MFSKSTWQHLRFPFSIFLLPIFLFAISTGQPTDLYNTLTCFIILHFLVYPASNGYNSYFDKDEESIGGVEKPLPVSKELYRVSLAMDAIALLLSITISWLFALMILLYGLVSKAYSHPAIRLKKYPILGWLIVGIFQGWFTYLLVAVAAEELCLASLTEVALHWPAALSTLLLWGSYPMTQVYQHNEDRRRGDRTLSLILGVRGTFHFTALLFAAASAGYVHYLHYRFSLYPALVFLLALSPVLLYFGAWYLRVRQSDAAANFKSTMRLNLLSSVMMILYFAGLMAYRWLG